MAKPRGATRPRPIQGQGDLLSCFRRQVQRQKEEEVSSTGLSLHRQQQKTKCNNNNNNSTTTKSTVMANNQSKRKRPATEGRKGKENSVRQKTDMTTEDFEDDDDDDVPLSALVKRPKKTVERSSNSDSTKKSTSESVRNSKKAPAKRENTNTNANQQSAFDVLNSSGKGGKSQNISGSSAITKEESNLDMALQFLDRKTNKKRSKNKDLTLKDIQEKTQPNKETAKKQKPALKSESTKELLTGFNHMFTEEERNIDNVNLNDLKLKGIEKTAVGDKLCESDGSRQQILRSSHNLVHQLVDRSSMGSRGRTIHQGPRMARALQIDRQRPVLTAKHASWIGLGTSNNNYDGGNPNKRIDCMAWDPMGVLLAVAQTCNITKQSWVDVFDWDSVCAADVRGRNARVRAQASGNPESMSRLDVPPLLQFRIPAVGEASNSTTTTAAAKKIPWIKWNPHNPDHLAIPSRCGTVVFCLNVSHVEAAVAAGPSNRISKPPRHSYWEFKPGTRQASSNSASACLFLDKDHIALAFGATLYCWRYYPKRDPTSIEPKLKWQYAYGFKKTSLLNKASIISLEAIGNEHLISGSSHGHLALIHWKRVVTATATSSFSLTSSAKPSSPTVIASWLSHAALGDQQSIPPENTQDPSVMGIQTIRVETIGHMIGQASEVRTDNETVSRRQLSKKSFEQLCGKFRIQWITRCGWCLSVTLVGCPSADGQWQDYKVRREKPRILYQTPLVQTKLAAGGSVTAARKEWSLPTGPVAADIGDSFACWQKVPPVTRILPHHDKRVLDEQPSLYRDMDISYQLVLALSTLPCSAHSTCSNDVSSPISLSLPKRRGVPKLVAVDPANQEWAVIATNRELLYVVNLKAKAP